MGYLDVDSFGDCTKLTVVHFEGDAPMVDWAEGTAFAGATNTTLYYMPGAVGWSPTLGGRPTAEWSRPYPVILTTPRNFGPRTHGFGFIVSWATNLSVVLEGATNFASPVWVPLKTNALGGGWGYLFDPNWTNYPTRFYRVRSR